VCGTKLRAPIWRVRRRPSLDSSLASLRRRFWVSADAPADSASLPGAACGFSETAAADEGLGVVLGCVALLVEGLCDRGDKPAAPNPPAHRTT